MNKIHGEKPSYLKLFIIYGFLKCSIMNHLFMTHECLIQNNFGENKISQIPLS